MCGIAGLIGGPPPEPAVLEAMAQEMVHRGPDGGACWTDEIAGLAFRRLAIIDLHERSNQPLHHGRWHLVFNGEIYNYRELRRELAGIGHRFVTEGDGEVLLHAWSEWGERSLDRLNGMFAFAVWDDERRALTLACDPFGEKPLFWATSGPRLLFASDVRALARAEPALAAADESTFAAYLSAGMQPAIDRTFFARVRRLPGAHLLRWRDGRVETRRYWTPRRVAVPGRYPDAVEALRDLLLDSIRLRLRSDVPVGTSLSGGVDSSAVIALSASIAGDHRRHAYTARFPGFARDEWPFASRAAAEVGVVEHHAVEPVLEDLLDDLPTLVRDQEQPFGSSSIYAQWRVMRAARESGVTVLLDGQGADELFGGYANAPGYAVASMGPRAAMRAVLGGADRGSVIAAAGAEWAPRALVHRHRLRAASPYAAVELRAAAARRPRPHGPGGGRSLLERELRREAFETSLPALLRYADRNSMAHSREVRLPFLDRRVAEFAFSAPPSFLYRGGFTKRLLRDAVAGVVPPDVLWRREKIGFETPQRRWLSSPAGVACVREVLLDPGAMARDAYDRAAIEADAGAGEWRSDEAIWWALNLELWLRAFASPARPAQPAAAIA